MNPVASATVHETHPAVDYFIPALSALGDRIKCLNTWPQVRVPEAFRGGHDLKLYPTCTEVARSFIYAFSGVCHRERA
jgi:hypothetical protein